MNFGERQAVAQEDIKKPENPIQENPEAFESEESIAELGERRISELDSQEAGIRQGGQDRVAGINNSIGLSSEKLNSLTERFGLSDKLANISEKGVAFLSEARARISGVVQSK